MAMRTLATGLSDRRNNFDFIRLVAAIMVIFSHSWPLTEGSNRYEPLAVFTHNQIDFGSLAVYMFFIISGFLIAMSYDRTRNLGRFVKARVLRIVPALLVVISLPELYRRFSARGLRAQYLPWCGRRFPLDH